MREKSGNSIWQSYRGMRIKKNEQGVIHGEINLPKIIQMLFVLNIHSYML